MAAPAVADRTRKWWESLPELYRAADEAQASGPNSYPLLRFLSLLGDQGDEIAALHARLELHDDGTGDWISDLGAPRYADASWLDWLAWLAGLGLTVQSGSAETFLQLVIDYDSFAELAASNLTFGEVRQHAVLVPGGEQGPEVIRAALLDLTGHRHAGSTGAWERLIRPYLTGAQRVLHLRIFEGDPWHLQLVTYSRETPKPSLVAAVIARAAKASGLTVTYTTRSGASFDEVTVGFDDFDDIVATIPSFGDLAEWLP